MTSLAIPAATIATLRGSIEELVERSLGAVAAASPEYDDVFSGDEGLAIRFGVEGTVREFVDRLEESLPSLESAEAWRRIGEAEFRAGRSLEGLRRAFRTGTIALWRGAAEIGAAGGLEPGAVAALAETWFLFTDELASEVVGGYLRAQSDEAGERDRRRRRLAVLLTDAEHHEPEAIERAASLAHWPLPRRMAALAFAGGEPPDGVVRALGPDALAGPDYVLVGDPEGPGRRALLEHALAGRQASLGPSVAPLDAARSLRLARLTLALIGRGTLAGAAPVRSADHLAELVVMGDEDLARELVATRLAPLRRSSPADRERLLDTLEAWLAHQRHTPTIAAELHVHPQTVRYRLGTLRDLLGEALETPDGRFELALAIHAERLLDGRRPRA